MRELQLDYTIDHTLPMRHERLRAFTKLKSQRQLLTAGIAILGAAALTLGGALWQQYQTPDLVKLGKARRQRRRTTRAARFSIPPA